MARETFTGKLIQTEVKNGPAGKPITQAVFHTVDDNTPVVAVWHDQAAPYDLQEGQTYGVEGSYVNHNGKHYFFKPLVELIEHAVPAEAAKVRNILFRPRDWRTASKVAVTVSVLAIVGLAGVVTLGLGSGASSESMADTEPVSSRQSVAEADTENVKKENPNGEDCSTQVVQFSSTTVDNPNLNVGVNKTVTKGVNGTKEVCYPDGRDQKAEETVVTKAVNEVIEKGTKPVPTAAGAAAPSNAKDLADANKQIGSLTAQRDSARSEASSAKTAQQSAEAKAKAAQDQLAQACKDMQAAGTTPMPTYCN